MLFDYELVDQWPRLAWLATSRSGSSECKVRHGKRVEVRPEWFCEAVWPGSFEEGLFDETDLIAGSGARIRDDRLIFASSGNSVDRLVWIVAHEQLWVSNSLSCLMAGLGATVDPSYPRYYEDFSSITKGLRAYKRTLATSAGQVGIQVFGNIVWNGREVSLQSKSMECRDFSHFASYEAFLRSNLESVARNMGSPERRAKYKFLATVSAGYDSATCAALAARVGCADALCIDRDRFGLVERGDDVARALGLNPIVVGRDAWRALERPEIPFFAAGGEAEGLSLAAASAQLDGVVLLTGYHGDKIWGKNTSDLSDAVIRGDHSGLSLTEFRLSAGFIHCPVTFWGVRQIAEIHRISNSQEMLPWDVGGDYSRPIPRRILETAGVGRAMFGIEKHASAVGIAEFLSENSLNSYREWLKAKRGRWFARGRLPPVLSAVYERISTGAFNRVNDFVASLPLLWRLAADNSLERPSSFRRYTFPWAIEWMTRMYRRPLLTAVTSGKGKVQPDRAPRDSRLVPPP